ncbi:MAG TPA: ABC transporter substrate-binding protein [Microvirga sp.]|jgi:iron complex transport system substrate-binding protein
MILRVTLAALALAALVNGALAQASVRPQRIVSLNLCADQLLLALADRQQIASLSPLARDPSLSFLAREAEAVPINGGRGEAILMSGADLVLMGRFGSHLKRELLERQGLAVMALEPWRSLDQGRQQIRAVAGRIGHPDRGERLIAAMDAALARSRGIVAGRRSILTVYRRGYVASEESITGEILRHMGFALHQEALGLRRGGLARLESIVAMPPDYALLDEASERAVDNGSALLVHPAFLDAVPRERRLTIPGHLTICGGPSTPQAIESLAAEVRAKVR